MNHSKMLKDCSYKSARKSGLGIINFIVLFNFIVAIGQDFDYKIWLFGPQSTLDILTVDFNTTTGEVEVNGVDNRRPDKITFDWGDGTVEDRWFPSTHTYTDLDRNYVIRVTSHYSDGSIDFKEEFIQQVRLTVDPQPIPSEFSVTIPDHSVSFTSRMPNYPLPNEDFFDDSFFTEITRSDVEYILTVMASIQADMVNNDMYLFEDAFHQVIVRDSSFNTMGSLWYTNPVAFVSGDWGFQGDLEWSSFMHEMGHNFTLNSPKDFYYGGKIDGNANAIFSESMARIFQYATGYALLNNYTDYGIGADMAYKIRKSVTSSIKDLRNRYDQYVSDGKNFSSWNDYSTPHDETMGTFTTIAYKFCQIAENSGQGYVAPLKKMMELLQVFNEDLAEQYDQDNNTEEAAEFRATLMVTAMSYGFSTDLRNEFRDLNFPISDAVYNNLMSMVDPNFVTINLGPQYSITFVDIDGTVSLVIDDWPSSWNQWGKPHNVHISVMPQDAQTLDGISMKIDGVTEELSGWGDVVITPNDKEMITIIATAPSSRSISVTWYGGN